MIHFPFLFRKVHIPALLSIPLVTLFLVSRCLLLFLVLFPHFQVFPSLKLFRMHSLTWAGGRPWSLRWPLYMKMGLRILFPCHLGYILFVVHGCILLSSILMVLLTSSRLNLLQRAFSCGQDLLVRVLISLAANLGTWMSRMHFFMLIYLQRYIRSNHLGLLFMGSIEAVSTSCRKRDMVSSSHCECGLGSFLRL